MCSVNSQRDIGTSFLIESSVRAYQFGYRKQVCFVEQTLNHEIRCKCLLSLFVETFVLSVQVVGVIKITTLTNRQYCVILDPVGPEGKPQLGQKKLVKVGIYCQSTSSITMLLFNLQMIINVPLSPSRCLSSIFHLAATNIHRFQLSKLRQ